MYKYLLRLCGAISVLSLMLVSFPFAVKADNLPLIISAVQITGGYGHTNDDFVELYNPNAEPVNLNGYRLVKRASLGQTDTSIKSWTSDVFIPGYSFYLWANSSFSTISKIPDVTTSSTLSSDNGVGLKFGALDTGNLVDSISWGAANNGFAKSGLSNPAGLKSIIRQDLFNEDAYVLQDSNPRSSKDVYAPLISTPTQQQLVDNALCSMDNVETNLVSGTGTSFNIYFENTGGVNWNEGYRVMQSQEEVFKLDALVVPSSKITIPITIENNVPVGQHSYEWGLQNSSGQSVGTSCNLDLNISSNPLLNTPPEQSLPKLKIQKLVPGDDSASGYNIAQVELLNNDTQDIDLTGLFLDIAENPSLDSPSLSDKAIALPKSVILQGKTIDINLPEESFNLSNNEKTLIIATSSGYLIDSVKFNGANYIKDSNFVLTNGVWLWVPPSSLDLAPNYDNDSVQNSLPANSIDLNNNAPSPNLEDLSKIVISEVYASPTIGDKEFLELHNIGSIGINLSVLRLYIGDKLIKLPIKIIEPNQFLVLQKPDATIVLPNGGKDIVIKDQNLNIISKLSYPKTNKGQSYSLINSVYKITQKPTPGFANQEIGSIKQATVASVIKSEIKKLQEKVKSSSVIKKAVSNKSKTITKKVPSKTSVKLQSTTQNETNTGTENKANSMDIENDFNSLEASNTNKEASGPWQVIVLGAAAVLAGGAGIYKYFISNLPI